MRNNRRLNTYGFNFGAKKMIDLNIANFISIALISVAGYAALKYALQMLGLDVSWMA